MHTKLAFALLLVAAAAAQGPPPKPKSALDKPTMEAYVRHLFLYGPQITVSVGDPRPSEVPGFQEVTIRASLGNVSEEKHFYVSGDGRKILEAKVYDVGQNPFKPELDKLKTSMQPSMGTPGAPVVIVLFSDFQCGYCKEEARMIRDHLLKEYPTQVRLYFKDFPLTQIHPWARPAALAGRCVFRQKPAAFWDYHDWVFDNQATLNEQNLKDKISEFIQSKGLDPIQLNSCMSGATAGAELDRSVAEGRSLGVNSTPTMFVNGRKIAFAIKWEQLKQVIDFEIGYQQTAKNAGEHCCTATLPNPLNPQP